MIIIKKQKVKKLFTRITNYNINNQKIIINYKKINN